MEVNLSGRQSSDLESHKDTVGATFTHEVFGFAKNDFLPDLKQALEDGHSAPFVYRRLALATRINTSMISSRVLLPKIL